MIRKPKKCEMGEELVFGPIQLLEVEVRPEILDFFHSTAVRLKL
jgi:hypothetical protein